MKETQFLFLQDASHSLLGRLEQDGAIECLATPPIHLVRSPQLKEHENSGILSSNNLRGIQDFLKCALACSYDTLEESNISKVVYHQLQIVGTALQLVKPVRNFSEYWIRVNKHYGIQSVTKSTFLLPAIMPDSYLRYQQHHVITPEDVQRAIQVVQTLVKVLELGHGSWTHPFGSVHRAVIFFTQGYSTPIDNTTQQLFWAAGLDSLFASKINRRLQGSRVISQRLQHLFGADFNPYDGDIVAIPANQRRPSLRLEDIGQQIFWLRNDYIHGLRITDEGWLSEPGYPEESGYAYQLLECTEILLRTTLLRVLEDSELLEIFRDPARLDSYF